MILLDSNVLIDATRPEMEVHFAWIDEEPVGVSAVTIVEVLGYHKLRDEERIALETYLGYCRIYPVDERVIEGAVRLRQARRISLGDAIIASTALVHRAPLATRNVSDYSWIEGIQLIHSLGRVAEAESMGPGTGAGDAGPLDPAAGPSV